MYAFTPQTEGAMVALVDKPLFDELIEAWKAQHPEKDYEVEWGDAFTGTVTYYVPTVYELDPQADPLTIGQD